MNQAAISRAVIYLCVGCLIPDVTFAVVWHVTFLTFTTAATALTGIGGSVIYLRKHRR